MSLEEVERTRPFPDAVTATTCPQCGNRRSSGSASCDTCGQPLVQAPGWALAGRDRRRFTRRRIIIGAVVLLALAFVFWLNYPFLPNFKVLLFNRPTSQLTSASLPGQWSMIGGDLARTKSVADAGLSGPPPAGKILWSAPLGSSTRSSPIAAHGQIYLGGHFKISAIDAATGAQLWERPASGPVQGSLAAAGDHLFVGLLDHRLLALESATGETRWEFKGSDFIADAPTVDQGMVYFGSWDGQVYALDAATGSLIWTYTATGPVASQAAVAQGTLAISDRNGQMHLLDARTGQNRLVFRTPKSAYSGAVIAEDMAFFSAGGRLYAIDATAKEIPGQYQFKRVWAQLWLWQAPGVGRPSGQQGGRWRFSPDGAESSIVAAPAAADAQLYVGDLQGILYAVDALTGKAIWQFQAQGGIYAAPLIVGDQVYIATQEGQVYAVDRHTGQPLWDLSLGSAVNHDLAFAYGRLYVRADDERLYAIE